MNRFFYPSLAFTNIRKNKTIYFPYLLASALMIVLYYALSSIAVMVTESRAQGMGTMSSLLQMSAFICALLSVVILFYSNSFVMKRRKKELGLYSILGMEKRHIAHVVFWEVLMTGGGSILCGVIGGALLSQLLFLVLLNIVGLPAQLTFQIPLQSVASTILLFAACFALVLVFDVLCISRADPIALLHGSKVGEREPKTRGLMAVLGVLTLGAGYFLALTAQNVSMAVAVFFPAVILVIIGTYCLFIAGSIALLKRLRRTKRFYYQPEHFVSVSGMLYRMKQNATGLATICILATSVLVTLSSTVCLFLGEEDILRAQFPRQVEASCIQATPESGVLMAQATQRHAQAHGFAVQNAVGYASVGFPASRAGEHFSVERLYNTGYDVYFLVLDDYNQNTGGNETLAEGEVLLSLSGAPLPGDCFSVEDVSYRVKAQIAVPEFLSITGMGDTMVVVVPDFAALEQANRACNIGLGWDASEQNIQHIMDYTYCYDVVGDGGNLPLFYSSMRQAYNESVPHLSRVRNMDDTRAEFYQLYGSLLFVGIFFVALFLIATVLIIYYKQVTEGYDDHERFQIMQNVGMSDREVHTTIRKQVLMVFFLPLGVAVVHIAVAFPVLCRLLWALNMANTTLFLYCVIGAVVLFAVLYLAVYQVTSRTYYRMVRTQI